MFPSMWTGPEITEQTRQMNTLFAQSYFHPSIFDRVIPSGKLQLSWER